MAKNFKHLAASLTVQPPDYLTADEVNNLVGRLNGEINNCISRDRHDDADSELENILELAGTAMRQLAESVQDPSQYAKFQQSVAELHKRARRLAMIAEIEGQAGDGATA